MADKLTQQSPKADRNALTPACCDSVVLDTCCAADAKAACCGPQPAPTRCGCGEHTRRPEE